MEEMGLVSRILFYWIFTIPIVALVVGLIFLIQKMIATEGGQRALMHAAFALGGLAIGFVSFAIYCNFPYILLGLPSWTLPFVGMDIGLIGGSFIWFVR